MTNLIHVIFLFVVVSIVAFLSPYSIFAQSPQLVITELMIDPKSVSDSDGEWVELYNPSDSEVDVSGAVLKDNGQDSHTIPSLKLPSKSYIVLCRSNDTNMNGGVNCQYEYEKFSLANEEDEVIVEKNGQTLAQFSYNNSFPVKPGKSMELASLSSTSSSFDSWHESTTQFGSGDYGTPGHENSGAPIPTSTKTPTPKPTDKPTKIPEPTKEEKVPAVPTVRKTTGLVEAEVLGETEEEDEKEDVRDKATPTYMPQPPDEGDKTASTGGSVLAESSQLEQTASNTSTFFLGGGVVTFIAFVISFVYKRKQLDG